MSIKDSRWNWECWQINVKRHLDYWRIYLFYYVHKIPSLVLFRRVFLELIVSRILLKKTPALVFLLLYEWTWVMTSGHTVPSMLSARDIKWPSGFWVNCHDHMDWLQCFQDMSQCFCCWTAEALIIYAILHVCLISALQVSWMVREQTPVISAETAGWLIQAIWALQWGILSPQPLCGMLSTWFDDGLCWIL